jgi:S-adenosylmethionine decarboxylase
LTDCSELVYLEKITSPLTSQQVTAPEQSELVTEKSQINGLHIMANFNVTDKHRLIDSKSFKSFIDLLIDEFKLSKVGEIYQELSHGGFSGVVCLEESHLSIHTWPEFHYLTFDVFLTNSTLDNQPTTHAFYHSVRHFFGANVNFVQFVNR